MFFIFQQAKNYTIYKLGQMRIIVNFYNYNLILNLYFNEEFEDYT